MNPGPASELPAISLENVTKSFVTDWRGRRRTALCGINLCVERGRVCALAGPNGSGKSTLLRVCAGLTAVDAGTVRINGAAPPATGIGYVPDHLALPGYLVVRPALTELAQLYGLREEEAKFEAWSALRTVGLEREASCLVGMLSHGQRQRLAIAQALLGRPQILLLDEPGAGLDPRALEKLGEILAALRAAGCTVLLSSHFLPQVEGLADEVVLLEAGRIVYRGSQCDLAVRGGLQAVYLEAVAP